jgi:anaerobic magnesium-protoporphyrin IX monomethyl ester cyclase
MVGGVKNKTTEKVVFVNPPFLYFPGNSTRRFNYCRPPLGLCYIAAYIKKHGKGLCDIEIVDTLVERRERRDWVGHIAAKAPGIIGFSVVTPTAGESCRMAKELREICPQTLFVAGGPHASVLPEEMLPAFDAVVTGEGERTFLELRDAVFDGRPFDGIDGVVFAKNGKISTNARREFISDLDEIPPPARELLNLASYYHSFPYRTRKGLFTTMFTSRGCPNNCYFCGNEALWRRKIRFHSVGYVRNELDILVKGLGVTLVFIDDDDFLAVKPRAMEICEAILKTGSGLKWVCHTCVSSIDEDSLRMMRLAGCVEIQIGVESGSDEILKGISKCESTSIVAEKLRMVKKSGMNSWATFIIGHLGDTTETIMETINFSIRIDPTYASFIMLLPFPGSRAFEEFRARGYIRAESWDDYTWHGDPVFEKPNLSAHELVRLRILAHKMFYLRSGKLFKLLIKIIVAGSLKEMMRNFLSWLSIVK